MIFILLEYEMDILLNTNVVKTWFYLFLLLTPFCGLVIYSLLVRNMTKTQKFKHLIQIVVVVLLCSMSLYYYGDQILRNLNIKLDALRVGAGVLLFLTGLKLIENKFDVVEGDNNDFVIPLCIPVIIGPATTSALIVLSAENGLNTSDMVAIILACLSLGLVFYIGGWLEKIIGRSGIDILSKLNGLYMIIIAAQLILVGLQNTFHLIPRYVVQ